jgi:hypothetical protein
MRQLLNYRPDGDFEEIDIWGAEEFSAVRRTGAYPVLARETLHPSLIQGHFSMGFAYDIFQGSYSLGIVPLGKSIPSVSICIAGGDEFSSGTFVSIGTNEEPEKLFPKDAGKLSRAAVYQSTPNIVFIEEKEIFLTTYGDPTQGKGIAIIYLA